MEMIGTRRQGITISFSRSRRLHTGSPDDDLLAHCLLFARAVLRFSASTFNNMNIGCFFYFGANVFIY